MADLDYNLLIAVRAVLIGDGTLTALVNAANIKPQDSPYPAAYPAITLAFGSEVGDRVIPDSLFGRFYIRIYNQGEKPYFNLYKMRDRVKTLLSARSSTSDITDANITAHRFYEEFCSTVISETETEDQEVYSLNSRYRFIATDNT